VTRLLEPVAVPADEGVLEVLPAVRAALSGAGPALLLHSDEVAPPPALRPGEPLGAAEDDPADPTVAVVATSGSTGGGKGVLLPASALLASVSATHDRLGGAGRWLLALPAQHVAGLQVLVRSLVGGGPPVVLDLSVGFRPEAFADAAARLAGSRRYTALVPTQLVRLLDAGGAALDALAGFDAVLVGGASTPSALRERAAGAGVRVVTTYGMTETCGGCVYDGVPFDGVTARVDGPAGRVQLGGPVLARGYRSGPGGDTAVPTDEPDRPGRTDGTPGGGFVDDADGTRWFATDDAGRLGADGRLEVLGRLDDVVVTGGLKVVPHAVESALLRLPGVREATVVAAPDPQWGQRVVAALVLADGAQPPTMAQVRDRVTADVAAHASPRQLLVLASMPLRGPGKPDRTAIARLAVLGDRG
jgi:O-succinylbenzoic acid--CoA ligase